MSVVTGSKLTSVSSTLAGSVSTLTQRQKAHSRFTGRRLFIESMLVAHGHPQSLAHKGHMPLTPRYIMDSTNLMPCFYCAFFCGLSIFSRPHRSLFTATSFPQLYRPPNAPCQGASPATTPVLRPLLTSPLPSLPSFPCCHHGPRHSFTATSLDQKAKASALHEHCRWFSL